jgi:hypothetical protein
VYVLHTRYSGRARSGQTYRWITNTIGKSKKTKRARLYTPGCLIMYNKTMGGVDKLGHLRSAYTMELKEKA